MFDFLKKNKTAIVAPMSGKVIPVTETPDPVFADKILGDGVAIEPTDNTVVAPCKGTIAQVAHTCHAIGIESEDGLEVLIHIGIDTVKLNGEGFECFVNVGDKVEVGDRLMEVDFDLIKKNGFSTVSPCIITNADKLKSQSFAEGEDAVAGETPVITYKL